jgi:hypothetical protein
MHMTVRVQQYNLMVTVKPDILLWATLQYCPTSCSFDRKIALSNWQATQTNYKLKIHNKICKQSLSLDYKKKEAPIQLLRLFDWLLFC